MYGDGNEMNAVIRFSSLFSGRLFSCTMYAWFSLCVSVMLLCPSDALLQSEFPLVPWNTLLSLIAVIDKIRNQLIKAEPNFHRTHHSTLTIILLRAAIAAYRTPITAKRTIHTLKMAAVTSLQGRVEVWALL